MLSIPGAASTRGNRIISADQALTRPAAPPIRCRLGQSRLTTQARAQSGDNRTTILVGYLTVTKKDAKGASVAAREIGAR
jgi:hypothetical protein